jgi:shikimate kinase
LRVSLVGVSCVGTTTIGRILADRRGWPFFDLDEEVERHFGLSIERLQARFLTGYSYRKECAAVLERIATATPDCVIALPPSGLRDAFLRVVRPGRTRPDLRGDARGRFVRTVGRSAAPLITVPLTWT